MVFRKLRVSGFSRVVSGRSFGAEARSVSDPEEFSFGSGRGQFVVHVAALLAVQAAVVLMASYHWVLVVPVVLVVPK